jgi:hypothetical protein
VGNESVAERCTSKEDAAVLVTVCDQGNMTALKSGFANITSAFTCRKHLAVGGNAEKADFVLAEYKGIVRGIFKPTRWYEVNDNGKTDWAFEGEEITDKSITDLYLNKKLPERKKGSQNPIRYSWNIK